MAYEIFKNTNSKKKKKNDDDDIFQKVSEFARKSANSGSRSEETPASNKPYKSAVTGYTPTSYIRDYDRYTSDKQSSTPSNDFKATAPSVTVESATESMKHNEEDRNFFQRIGSGVKDYLGENLEGYSFMPTSGADFAKGLGYNAERLMVSPLIGFTENILDFAGSAFYGAGEQLTSGFGLAPNKVSEWMGNAAESYLQEDWQGSYEKSIRERYNPTNSDEFVTGLAQNVPNILLSIGTGKGVASALGKGAQIVDKAADALKAQKASKATFGLMAAGGGANQAYDEGATVGQSLAYGTATGMLELITEELAGAIPEFGGGKLTQIASRFIDNPVINKMIDIGGEGVEEVIVEMASPFIKRAIYDSDAELATPEQIVESAIMGMVTAGLLQAGVQAPIAVSAARQASQQKGAAYNSDIGALISEGLQSDPNSASYKLASQLQAKLDNGETISNNEALRLAKANQKAINLEMKQASTAKATAEVAPVEATVEAPAQSRAQTIEARLTESGMDATQASAVAQSLDRILAGDTTVTNKDKGVLSVGNNIARQIFTEESGVTLPASNSSTRKAVSEYIAQTAMKQPTQEVVTEAKPVENVMTAWQNQKAQEQTVSQLKDSGSPFAVTTNSAEATLRQAAQEAVRKSKGQDVVINQSNMASLGSNGKMAYQKHIGNAKSVSGFSNAFQRYYDAGAIGVPFESVKTAYDGAADRSVLYEAYSAGVNDASVRSEGKSITEKKTKPKTKNKAVKSKGRFYDNRSREGAAVAEKDLTALKQVARAFNVDIEVVDTIADSEGRSIANGYYKNGKIVIAADSDNPMMTVLKHEITHHLQRVSPQKYKQFKDYVLKAYFDNSQESMNAEIQRRMTLASLNNMELTRSEAMDEIVADATESFLTDRDSIDALIRENRSLGQTILNAIRDVLHKVEAALKGVDLKGYSGFMNADQLRTAEKMWVEALAAASQNEIGIDSVTISESSAPVWSMKSMKFDLLDGKMQRDLVEHGILTVEETDHLMSEISKLIDDMSPFAHIVDMNEEYGRDNRPYAVYKPNSDPLYKVSLDFSTLCKKRLMTQFVMESLQTKLGKALSAKEQIAIRSKLEEYGKTNKQIQVACALCYVEARRLKAPDQINRFLDNRTEILTDYFGKKNKAYKQSVDDMAAKMKVDMGYKADTALKAMKPADKKKINTAKQKMMKEYTPTAEEQKIIARANAIENAEFLSQDGLTRLNLNDPVIYDAFVTHVRNATKSKALEGGVPYYYGDSKSVSDALINAMNAENGLRHQSWSDFEIVHLLDTIAAVIDLSVRKAKVQSYTKVPAFVHVNGKTGMMINLSLIPAGSNGMKDGKLDFSPVEGMDYNVAVELRDQYHKTSGTIAIGIDDTQIQMLLDDPTIDYVIPYHTSGMNAQLRKMAGIAGWADYESYQSEKEIKGAKQGNCPDELWHKKPDFSEWFDTSKLDMSKSGVEIMREAANRYLQLCKERGLSPKFSNSKKHTDFSKHKNYWKLLIDRKMVDGDGNIIIQQEVRPDFDFDKIREVVQTEIDNYDPTLLDSLHDQIFEAWEKGEIKQREAELLADEKAKKKAKKKAAKVANGLMEQVVAPEDKKQFSLKSNETLASEAFLAHINDVISKGRGWRERDVTSYIDQHKELDFVERIYEGDKTAKADLTKFLNAISDTKVLDGISWYIGEAYGAKGREFDFSKGKADYPYRGAVRTFRNAIKKRVNDIVAERVGGTDLGIKNGDVSMSEVRDLYARLNSNKEITEFAERVFDTAEKLGVNIRFTNQTFAKGVGGDNLADMVEYKTSYFNDRSFTDQRKANTLLHEMIHACTVYVMVGGKTSGGVYRTSGKSENYVRLTDSATRLNAIYNKIKDDSEFKGQYGITNPMEMVAELSNENFVGLLKKKTLWDEVVDWICELFGFRRGNSAYENARMCVDYIIDNPEVSEYKEYVRKMRAAARRDGYAVFGETQFSLKDSDYMDAVNRGDTETAQRMVDEKAKKAGFDPVDLYHGTSAFGFTKVDSSAARDSISFFATTRSEVAEGYVYGGANVREIGDRRQQMPVVSKHSSVKDILSALKTVDPSYENARVATEKDMHQAADRFLSKAVTAAKDLRMYAIPEAVDNYARDLVYAIEYGDYNKIAELAKKRKTLPREIEYNGNTYVQASNILDELKHQMWSVDRALNAEDAAAIPTSRGLAIVPREDLVDTYNTALKGANSGIYRLYASNEKQFVINGNGANWDTIPVPKSARTGSLAGKTTVSTRDIAAWAKANGYNSVRFNDIYDAGAYGSQEISDVFAFFTDNDNLVKSADPVTYDDNGKVVPLSKRFDKKNADIRYSLKDSDYMAAVESGDMETVQAMVDQAAKKAGYKYEAYHGTNAMFNVFSRELLGSKNFMAESATKGFFAAASKETAENYTGLNEADQLAMMFNSDSRAEVERLKAKYGYDEAIRRRDANREKFEEKWKAEHGYHDHVTKIVDTFMEEEEFWRSSFKTEEKFNEFVEHIRSTAEYDWNGKVIDKKTGMNNISQMHHDFENSEYAKEVKELDEKIFAEWSDFEIKRKGYTPNVKHLYVKLDNPLVYDFEKQGRDVSFSELMDIAKERGCDGCIFKNVQDGADFDTIYTVFDNTQFKSADPVTYDDDGNVIPLSKRFNSEEQDIRYQLKSADEMLEMSKQIAEAEHKAKAVTDAEVMSQAINKIAKTDEEKAVVRNYQNATKKLAAYEQELATYEATKAEHGKGRSIYTDASGKVKKSGVKYSAAEKAEIQRKIELWKRNLRDIERKEAFKKVLAREKAKMAETHAKEISKLRASYDARLADLRAKRDAKIEAQKQKMRDYKQHQRDSKAYKELKGKLEADVKWLNERLDHPTDAKHIPEDFRKGVAAFLKSLDFETKYTDRNEIKNGKPSQKVIRLRELNKAYKKILEDQSSTMELDAVLLETLEQLEKVTENRRVADLTYEELSLVRDAIHYLKQNIVMSNKFFNDIIKESVSALGDKAISQMRSKKVRKEYTGIVGETDKLLAFDNVAPADKFHEFGGVMEKLYGEIRKGFDRHIDNVRTAIAEIGKITDGHEDQIKEWTGKKAKATKFSISDGTTIELTPAQVMSLYVLMKRDQAVGHVLGSGIVPSDVVVSESKKVGKGKITLNTTKKITAAKASRCTIEDIQKIVEGLSEDQRRIADGVVKLFTTKCADWGNETAMKLYGYKKFTEEHYFPIRSSDAYLNARFDDGGDVLVKNLGFTKNTVVNANNPIVVEDIFDVLTDHVNKMSMYNALVVPLTDFTRVFNYKTKAVNKDGDVVIRDSVQKALEASGGKLALGYVKQFMKDVNKQASSLAQESIGTKALTSYKKAKIGANLRVLIQQPTSIVRAADMVDPQYLIEGLKKKPNYEELFENSEIAYWKSLGFYQTDVGRNMKDILMNNESVLDKITMDMYGKADDFAWGHIWEAVKLEQADNHPDVDKTSSEFMDLVKSRFAEVVDRTQVVDSVFHRSQLMRSSSLFTKMVTAFMSEPTKSYNMLRTDLKDSIESKDYSKFKRSAVTFVANGILVSMFAAFLDALRDDEDEDEEGNKRNFLDKYLDAAAGNMLDNLVPLSLVPYVKDIVSIANGYDISRMDMAAATQFMKVARKWTTGKHSFPYLIRETVSSVADLFGIPVKNALRDVDALVRSAGDLFGGHYYADYLLSKARYKIDNPDNRSVFYKHYTDALAAGDQEAADLILTDMVVNGIPYDNIISKGYQGQKADAFSEARKLIADGKTAEAKSLIRKLAKEYDKKYTTLWKAVKNGDPSNTPEETYDYKDLQKAVRKGEDTELIEDYLIEYGGYSEEAMEEAIKMLTEKYK